MQRNWEILFSQKYNISINHVELHFSPNYLLHVCKWLKKNLTKIQSFHVSEEKTTIGIVSKWRRQVSADLPGRLLHPQTRYSQVSTKILGSPMSNANSDSMTAGWSESREYWMIYRGPGFLAVVWFGSSPTPLPHPPSSLSKLNRQHTGRLRKKDKLLTGEGGRGWARSWIFRPQESLFIYKSFGNLWSNLYFSPAVILQKDEYQKLLTWTYDSY